MEVFKIDKDHEIRCVALDTRNGFKHEATLFVGGREDVHVKIAYLNRTWERFEFEDVIRKLLDKTGIMTERRIKNYLNRVANGGNTKAMKNLKTVATVAGLGDIFGQTLKQKNDWKKKMLLAGLENKGISFPDDFDNLPEEERAVRLDGAIKQLQT